METGNPTVLNGDRFVLSPFFKALVIQVIKTKTKKGKTVSLRPQLIKDI